MNKMDEALATKDVKRIRNLLKAYITADPADSSNTIKLTLLDIRESGITVFEKSDDVMMQNDRSRWTEEYFVDLQVRLRNNFSEERYKHMLEVGAHVYPQVDDSTHFKNEDDFTPRPKKLKATIGFVVISLFIILLVVLVSGIR